MVKLAAGDILLLLGPTGAGKSLQAAELSQRYNWHWISSGKILRRSANPEVQAMLNSGRLLDNRLVDETVAAALDEAAAGQIILLDGYPRHIEQAVWLEEYLATRQRNLAGVVLIALSRQESEKRLAARGRGDDLKQSIERKWRVYEHEVKAVIDYYRDKGLLLEVDGAAAPAAVTARIERALGIQAK